MVDVGLFKGIQLPESVIISHLFYADDVMFIGEWSEDTSDRKITWAAWDKVLASKKNEGLGVSSFFALNRALLLNGFGVLFLKMVLFGVGLFELCMDKGISVAIKLNSSLDQSFRRGVHGGIEFQQLMELQSKLDLISLSHSRDYCLPTRVNLARRGIVLQRICRWWDLVPHIWTSFMEWQSWFSLVRFTSKVKDLLEGAFLGRIG
nr:RNA-directed DNA polymerase, eukaryota [Tanacetum cinerariifolium]